MRKTMTAPPLDLSDIERIAAEAGIDLEEVEASVQQIASAPAFAEVEARFAALARRLDADLAASNAGIAAAQEFLATGFAVFDRQALTIVDEFEANFVFGTATFDPEPDTPLTLDQAVCLPELGGKLLRNHGLSLRSPKVARKTLETAINRGKLAVGWFNTKNLFVTRRGIQEWIQTVQSEGMKRETPSKAEKTTIKEVRDRQKGTRSAFAAESASKTRSALDEARARIAAGKKKFKEQK
ncbi:hypothetical protein ACCS54_18695 [Rhizobium johnstonii]|uniref:hypothetical protein n=1 Tax=Rhizobium johnstonii TaxID=3019933 RepID=UPI003F9B3F4B